MKNAKKQKVSTIFLMAMAMSVAVSCSKDDNKDLTDEREEVVFGAEVAVGNGKVRSFIKRNEDGSPKSFGLTFPEGALEGLPEEGGSYIIPMPADNNTIVNHVSFDYAAHHHVPVYDTPHITTHFYFISEEEKNNITDTGAAMENLPAAEFRPTNYIPTEGGVPKMGKHWLDSKAEELNGQPFKRSLAFGSYDGKFIFFEPLINMEFLRAKPNAAWPVEQQSQVQTTGFYANSYALAFDENTALYTLSFDDLRLRSKE